MKAMREHLNSMKKAGKLKSGKKWIAGAIKHPGALTKKAKAAGESPMTYAHEHAHSKGRTGKQARLALTLRGFHKK